MRTKGELILREGAPQATTAAEEHFLQSLAWHADRAPCHGSCEHPQVLRALQQDQSRAAEARNLLQSVYDPFIEGFESGDLKTVKAYLEALQ